MAEKVPRRSQRRVAPEAVRVPLALIGLVGALAAVLGLYVLSTVRDEGVAAAMADTELVADLLLDEPQALQRGEEALLARAVLGTQDVRAARLAIGEDGPVATVGPAPPEPTGEDAAAAVAAGDPVVTQAAGSVVVTSAIARVGGEPVVLTTRSPQRTIGLGWTGIVAAWLLVSLAIVAVSIALERRRRDRVMTLEETVQALYAHDTQVTRQQQELLRSKTEFVNAISQELRTPLEVIKGIADRLRAGGELTDGERRDLVDALLLNADRLDTLVGDLIDVDRLTLRTVTVRRRPVRIAAALDAALEEIDTAQHVLRVAVGDVTANATPGHVERILRALLHNAVKYAPPGSAVTVGAERDGDAVLLRVDDEGPGIPTGDRSTVFEPLRQLGDDPGMGLGLALVKRFTELHGGRVWVESAPSGGAGFRVLLPDEGEPVRVDPWRLAGVNVTHEADLPVGTS